MSTINYLTVRNVIMPTLVATTASYSVLTGSSITVTSTITTSTLLYSTLIGKSINTTTLALSTLTVSSINNNAPGTGTGSFSTLTVSSLVSVSSIQTASTMYTSTLFTTGNMGVGTSVTVQTLTVNGSIGANQPLYLTNQAMTNTNQIQFNNSNAASTIYTIQQVDNAGANYLRAGRNGYGDIVVNSSGNVGVGKASPYYTLDVTGTIAVNNGAAATSAGQYQGVQMYYTGTGATAYASIVATNPGSTYNALCLNPSSGNIGIGTTNPSAVLSVWEVAVNGDVTRKNMFYGSRNGTASVQNAVSMAFALGPNVSTIAPYGALDIKVNGAPVAGNSYGTVPDVTVVSIIGNGNVGIGTTNPNATLAINSGTTNNLAFTLNSAGAGWGSGMQFINTTATTGRNYGIYAGSEGNWHFADATAGSDRIVVNSSGYVGIGVVSPIAMLHVSNTTAAGTGYGLVVIDSANTGGAGGALTLRNSAGGNGAFASLLFENDGSTSATTASTPGAFNQANGMIYCQNLTSTYSSNAAKMGFQLWSGSAEVEVMTMLPNGNIGINTTSPTTTFQVVGASSIASTTNVAFTNSGGGLNASGGDYVNTQLAFGGGYGPWIRAVQPNSTYTDQVRLDFCTNLSSNNATVVPRMSILSGSSASPGYVGIGTTSPGNALDVQGYIQIGNNGSIYDGIMFTRGPTSGSYPNIRCQNNYIAMYCSNAGGWSTDTAVGDMILRTASNAIRFNVSGGGNASMVIASGGNVGVGITNPASLFSVVGGTTMLNAGTYGSNNAEYVSGATPVLHLRGGSVGGTTQMIFECMGYMTAGIACNSAGLHLQAQSGGNVYLRGGGVYYGDYSSTGNVGLYVDTNGFTRIVGGSLISLQNATNGGAGRGISYWTSSDSGWASYMATSGSGTSFAGGTACTGAFGFTQHAIRMRARGTTTQGFIWENDAETCIMSIRGDGAGGGMIGAWGVNTLSPAYTLDVNGSSRASEVYATNWFRLNGTGGVYWTNYGRGIQSADTGGGAYGNISTYGTGLGNWQGYNISGRFNFMSNGNSHGIYDQSYGWTLLGENGNVGINGSPIAKFNVIGGSSVFNGAIFLNSNINTINPAVSWDAGTYLAGEDNGSTGTDLNVYSSWAGNGFYQTFKFNNSGYAYNYRNSWGGLSDATLKENIVDARDYLEDINKLRVVKYSFIKDKLTEPNQLGLLAQEVEEIFPKLVTNEKIDKEDVKCVKTSVIIMMMLKSIQTLSAKVSTLETERTQMISLMEWAKTQGFSG